MNNKLELTWVGKNSKEDIEPRILIYKEGKSYGDKDSKNMLIHGDNLLALKALEKDYSNKIKCIYIDPPYNTGSAFEHYDDNLEHSIWLDLMYKRLNILHKLLSSDGSISVQIDSVEMPYLKVMMDEIFGRKNFINIISVKAKIAGVSGSNLGKSLQDNVEYIIMYAKNISDFNLQEIPQKKQELMSYIRYYIEEGKSWKYTSVLVNEGRREYVKSFKAGNGDEIKLYKHYENEVKSINQIAKEEFDGNLAKAYYKYIDKIFRTTNAQTSIRTKVIEETKELNSGQGLFSIDYIPIKGKNGGKLITSYYKDNNLIAWLKDVVNIEGNKILKMDNMGNLWDDIQYNNLTKEGKVQFPNGKKPESIIERIILMTTNENDFVLDSFLGSGTTCAVAHKLNRNWIGIEMGDHINTHCRPRLNSIIDNQDSYGTINLEKTGYKNGYKFYELAPTLIKTDMFEQEILNKEYDEKMLSEAVALHEGFNYNPSQDNFWKQSKANENSYLFVTTNFVSEILLDKIKDEMKENEYLIIACTSYDENIEKKYKNIKLKKIPEMILKKYEYDVDNYSFNIIESYEEVNEDE